MYILSPCVCKILIVYLSISFYGRNVKCNQSLCKKSEFCEVEKENGGLDKMSKKRRIVSLLLVLVFGISLLSEPLAQKKISQAATYKNVEPNFLLRNVYGAGGAGSSRAFGRSSSVPAPFNSSHNSMNGLAVRAGGDWRLSYCLGYGLSLSHYDTLQEKSSVKTSDNFGTKYRDLETWQKKYIQLAMTYGLNDLDVSHTQSSIQSLIRNNKALYGVTQVMVWSICHSRSESAFRNSEKRNKIRNRYLQSGDRNKYNAIYEAMIQAYDGSNPFFAKESEGQCKMSWLNGKNSEKDSTLTLPDKNGLISHGKNNKYSYTEISSVVRRGKTAVNKLKIKRSGNNLTFTIKKGDLVQDGDWFLIKLKTYYTSAKNKAKAETKCSGAITLQKDKGNGQALGVAEKSYKVKTSYLKVGAKKSNEAPKFASISIRKEATDGNVSGFRFLISRDMTLSGKYGLPTTTGQGTIYNQLVYTGTDGTCTVTGLPQGVYEISEVGYGKCTSWTNLDYMSGGFITEKDWTYPVKAQSCVLSLYRKYYSSSNAFVAQEDEVNQNYASAKKTVSHSSMKHEWEERFGIRNTAKCYLIVKNNEEASVTIHNDREPNHISLKKSYTDQSTYKSTQAVKDGDIFELKANINRSSAWGSFPADLQNIFGLTSYYNGQPLATMVISNGAADSGNFYVLPNLDTNGGYDNATDGNAGAKINSSTAQVTELNSSSGSSKGSISNDGRVDMSSLTPVTISAENIVENTQVKIAKRDSETKKIVKKAGFKFEIIDAYTKKSVGVFSTDETGIADPGTLGYGTYMVKEVEVPKPYKINEQCYYFTVGSDGTESFKDYEVTDVDSELNEGLIAEAPVTNNTKEDISTEEGETVDIADNDEANQDDSAIDTTETDINQNYTDELHKDEIDNDETYGVEDKAAQIKATVQKYITDCKAVEIKNQTPDKNIYTMNYYNENTYGKFTLLKTTESLALDNIKKNVLSKYGITYDFSYEKTSLENVEFEIIAQDSIEDEDGNIVYASGDIVTVIKTDQIGKAVVPRLYVGKYAVKETKTAKGKIIDKSLHNFEIKHDGQDCDVTMDLFNERQKAKISIYKKMEVSSLFNTSQAYKDVKFGLYTAEEIKDEEGTIVIPANALLDVTGVIPQEDYFAGEFSEDVPYGKYYVKEIETNSRYELDTEIYPVEFVHEDFTTPVKNIRVNLEKGGFIINHLKKIGKVQGSTPVKQPKEKKDSKINTKVRQDDNVVSTGDNTPIGIVVILLCSSLFLLIFLTLSRIRANKKIKQLVYKEKRNGKKLFLFLLFCFCFSLFMDHTSFALTKEFTYKSVKENYETDLPGKALPETLTEAGKEYKRANISFDLLSAKDVAKTKKKPAEFTYTKRVSGLKRKNFNPEKEKRIVDKDGRECIVTLSGITYEPYTVEKNQRVSAETDFGKLSVKPSVPKTKTVSVKNKVTGKYMTVPLKLKQLKEGTEEWEAENYPFSVTQYDADHYVFEGAVFENAGTLDLPEDLILRHLRLSAKKFQLQSMDWEGGAYEKNGIITRNATAVISGKVKRYVAVYQANVPIQQTLYRATAQYNGTLKEEKVKEYKVKAFATYQEVVKPTMTPEPTKSESVKEKKGLSPLAVAGIVLSILLVIAFVIVLIYQLSKKNKSKDKEEKK